jgi:hypothetical protein
MNALKYPKAAASTGAIHVSVQTESDDPITGALVALVQTSSIAQESAQEKANLRTRTLRGWCTTRAQKPAVFNALPPGEYEVIYLHHASEGAEVRATVTLGEGASEHLTLRPISEVHVDEIFETDDGTRVDRAPRVGEWVHYTVDIDHHGTLKGHTRIQARQSQRSSGPKRGFPQEFWTVIAHEGSRDQLISFEIDALPQDEAAQLLQLPADQTPELESKLAGKARFSRSLAIQAVARDATRVTMSRTETEPTGDMRLWAKIRDSTELLSFSRYASFIDQLIAGTSNGKAEARFNQLNLRRSLPFTDSDAYRVLKAATEAFVMVNCGIVPTDGSNSSADTADYLNRRDLPTQQPPGYFELLGGRDGRLHTLPYLAIIRRKLGDVPMLSSRFNSGDGIDLDDGFVEEKLRHPCLLELIWSYWHEEGMQVQAMNAISRRFQNVRSSGPSDPLANMEINPLRPLNNLIWSYIQDEQHRLTVVRRNYEYDHHYGLRLEGRALQDFRPADTRSKFIEAFHELLRLCSDFYKQDDDTTVKADAFGVLNALKEVHLILSQGAHCQFGDLPGTARIEMLMQQWLLARPEFREFLPTRVMVAYPEPWMDRVDAMKKLQGWTDTSVMHFHNLAVFGEQILLSVRYGNWSSVFEPNQAFNFTRFWRPQIQGYIHAYRAATGIELGAPTVSARVDATLPSVLLQRRLQAQQRGVVAR